MTLCPPKIHVHLKLVNVALFGNSLCRCTQVKMGPQWIGAANNPKREIWRHTREKCHVKVKAKIE